MLTLAVQQSDSAMRVCVCVCVGVGVGVFLIFFSIMVYHRILKVVLSSRTLLYFHPIYKVASASPKVPNKPSPSPMAATSLFSMSESVSLP